MKMKTKIDWGGGTYPVSGLSAVTSLGWTCRLADCRSEKLPRRIYFALYYNEIEPTILDLQSICFASH